MMLLEVKFYGDVAVLPDVQKCPIILLKEILPAGQLPGRPIIIKGNASFFSRP